MRFREHRGGLDESLATTIEVKDAAALVGYARSVLGPYGVEFEPDDVLSAPYGGDDDRIGWKDVHIITINGYGVFGFIEGDPRASTA